MSKTIRGTNRADTLFATDDGSRIEGLGGNDRIEGSEERDVILGGTGRDRIDAAGGDDYIDAGRDDDRVSGGAGDDEIRGGQGQDLLGGGEGDDQLYGGSGNDILGGAEGYNTLNGGTGNDILLSGGSDELTGGRGADEFRFFAVDPANPTLKSEFHVSSITDFNARQGDTIELHGISSIDSFDDLTITDSDQGAVIHYGDTLVVVEGVAAGDLDASSFAFNLPSPDVSHWE